jgi:hypothetical protein
MQILLRARYDEMHEKAGIRRLLADGTYVDCFTLHEGVYNKPASDGQILDRYLLYLIWARPGQWYSSALANLVDERWNACTGEQTQVRATFVWDYLARFNLHFYARRICRLSSCPRIRKALLSGLSALPFSQKQ